MTEKVQLRIALLVSKFLANKLTNCEKSELATWLDKCATNRARFERWSNIHYLMGKAEKKLEDPNPLPNPLDVDVEKPNILYYDKELVPVMFG